MFEMYDYFLIICEKKKPLLSAHPYDLRIDSLCAAAPFWYWLSEDLLSSRRAYGFFLLGKEWGWLAF